MALYGQTSYRFGAFRLDPADRALRHGSQRLDLPPRAFDTLVVLVEEKGKLVEKERLMRIVWPTTVVEENNLSQAVYLLRKVLRDGENGTRYIETVPKQGYRFVAQVREVKSTDDESEGVLSSDTAPDLVPSADVSSNELAQQQAPLTPSLGPQSKPRWIPITLVALAIAALALIGILFNNWRGQQRNNAGLETIRSIAVLPLQNLSNDPEQEYFADGMTDELITDLAQLNRLRVVSKTSIMRYKGTKRALPQIGRDLGVDAVIEGSVLRSGDRVRITAQLIRTATDSHLWAKSYEGELKDVLSLQAVVAEAITDEVKLNLTDAERNRLHRPHEVNPEAYEAYLRGRFAWNRRDDEGFAQAVQYYDQAIAKDPDFALAYSGLADCYILMDLNVHDPDRLNQAKTAALKAISLDDELAEAHTSLAAVKIFDDWDWAGAESEFKRAIELNPNSAPAHHWYANLLLDPLGRYDEAMAELKRAQGLDPLSLIINTDIGYSLYLARHSDEAFAQYQKVLAMDPSFISVHSDLARYYMNLGKYDDWLREMLSISGPEAAQEIRGLYAKGGFRAVTEEFARTRGTLNVASRHGSFFGAAMSYAVLNQHPQALAALEKSYEAREPGLIYLKVAPEWDGLRDEPAFQSVQHRMGLQ
jgi:TolB-like protein/DNA-binding winged helix-turn-helix (wHTH) protein